MNIIFKDRQRRVLYSSFARVYGLLCVCRLCVCLNGVCLSFCSLLNIRFFWFNSNKPGRKKQRILLVVWSYIDQQGGIWGNFPTIFWVDPTWFLKMGVGCNTLTHAYTHTNTPSRHATDSVENQLAVATTVKVSIRKENMLK